MTVRSLLVRAIADVRRVVPSVAQLRQRSPRDRCGQRVGRPPRRRALSTVVHRISPGVVHSASRAALDELGELGDLVVDLALLPISFSIFSTAWMTVVWSRPPNSRAIAG